MSISFLPLLRAFEAQTQFGPLRTLHQGQLGDRRGPLRATADWRGTYSDLDRATARCSAHQTDSMTGNGRPSTLRKPPTTPAAKLPMVSLSLVLVYNGSTIAGCNGTGANCNGSTTAGCNDTGATVHVCFGNPSKQCQHVSRMHLASNWLLSRRLAWDLRTKCEAESLQCT